MTTEELKKVVDDVSRVIYSLRQLMDYVQSKDSSLYYQFYLCWNKLCNINSSGMKFLQDYKPLCFDSKNCPNYGFGCPTCSNRPS